jgi:hypothetical protein
MVVHYQSDADHQHDSGFGGSDTDAEYELDLEPSHLFASTVGESSGYITQASSAPLLHHPQPHYHPVPIQAIPISSGPPMMTMRGRTMDPSQQGRSMSIHAMLSPSPPGDAEQE